MLLFELDGNGSVAADCYLKVLPVLGQHCRSPVGEIVSLKTGTPLRLIQIRRSGRGKY